MVSARQEVIAAVSALGVPYELITIDPAYADTAAFCQQYGYPPERSCNTFVVASKKEPKKFAACVVLATTQLDVNRRARKLLEVSKANYFVTGDKLLLRMKRFGITLFLSPRQALEVL